MIDTPSWHRIKEIVEAALALPHAERSAFVTLKCGSDLSLKAEVESLLAAIDHAGDFIDRPALGSLRASSSFPAGWIPDLGRRALQPGDSVGPYSIREFVGAGGMGEVYRAHDANLNRDVALKVRPAAFALDADRFARFRREAQMLAALNHPNVAAIYGLENSDGIQALVLELVDGVTLADRIQGSRFQVNEVLPIATQIAEGLEAAHKRGIIHSDLKPANIKLRSDGSVKILDFGLARALDAVDESPRTQDGASGTNGAVSQSGLIFGTAAYMSPEQARGKPIDKRTDVWAFGCVLFEMLTGRAAFGGKTIDEILDGVLNHAPDWSLVPADTPVGIVKLLHKCLQKNSSRRLHDIADARIELEDVDTTLPMPAPQKRSDRLMLAVLAAIAAIGFSLAVWSWLRQQVSPETPPSVKRLLLRLPEAGPLARPWSLPLGLSQLSLAISPDGTRVVYVLESEGVTQLYLHNLDRLEPVPIPGTPGAFGPFFSPDGKWIGFFAENKLKKVAVSGGEPIELSPAPNPYGGSWGPDGMILFSSDEGRRPMRISESGGEPQPLPVLNSVGSWRRPDILPGGKAAIVSNPQLGVTVLSLETGEYRVLVEGAGGGRYVPGYLVFARPGVLLAAPFDLDRFAVTGPEAVVLENVQTEAEGVTSQPQAVFSPDGTLVYASGGAPKNSTRPVWVNRRGEARPVGMPPRTYGRMKLSPDGRFLAIFIADPKNDLWVQDLERDTLTRLTSGLGPDALNWAPDGERIVIGKRGNGKPLSLSIPRDGSREPEPFVTADGQAAIGDYSPDGRLVASFGGNANNRDNGLDIWVRELNGKRPDQPFVGTRFTEAGPRFSPDGRWIAYVSDESGQYEVYVRPYPARDGKWQISTDGGEEPVWSRDGKELFYRSGRKWMVAAVTLKPEFTTEKPKFLFEGHYRNVGGTSYDVARDGQRFLMLEPVEAQTAPVTHLNVVLNWFSEVSHRVGPVTGQASR